MQNGQGDNNKLNLTSQCGPGCDCAKPSGNKKMKMVVSLIVILAACGVLTYKMTTAKAGAQDSKKAAFSANISQPSGNVGTQGNEAGEPLDSLNDLNQKAVNKDAVFICVPAPGGDGTVKKETTDSVNATIRSLKSSKINAGMYILKPPDYAKLIAKPTPPEVMVISRGGSAVMVAGAMNETNLMQAFVASMNSGGGCCGSGSGSKCK